jgi:hypothetical protein
VSRDPSRDAVGAVGAASYAGGMVNLPEQPPVFRSAAQPDRTWRWRLEAASGDEVTVDGELADQLFPSQSDAETWVGEVWAELAERGVDAVTLIDGDRVVYGPMSLHA